MDKTIEILAPAGSYDTLKAAVAAGADAIYVGGSKFGARAYAQNFTQEELLAAIDYVHLHGRKLYLTVNTLLKDTEIEELYEYLQPYYLRGLDAVIVQDMGVMLFVKEHFPDLSIHASTQMTITNVISAKYLESIGVERVVPARELSIEEIKQIAGRTALEIECFVHGALCYCYSGQCLLSSMIGGRSGNRGQCAQPCRLPYFVDEKSRDTDIMSLKDLCTIRHIPELVEAGITSFKIEGRMKQAQYVSAVSFMYRKYVDKYISEGKENYAVDEADVNILMQAYQRRGYCDGYYYRHNGMDMLSLERPQVLEHADTMPEIPQLQEKINGKLIIFPGKHAKLIVEYKDIVVETEGAAAEVAMNQPVSEERLGQQLRKTGNTPFVFERLEIALHGNVFLPMQSVNELRRTALWQLQERVLESFQRAPSRKPQHMLPNVTDMDNGIIQEEPTISFYVSVENVEQLEVVSKHSCVARIYVEDIVFSGGKQQKVAKAYLDNARNAGKELYFSMARIFREKAVKYYKKSIVELTEYFDGALVRNLESFLYLKSVGYKGPVVTDANVYQWNQWSKLFWRELGACGFTAPIELNYRELKHLGIQEMELPIYGYTPVMVSAGCIKKNTTGCKQQSGSTIITDRYRKKFVVKNECTYCYNIMYNAAPVVLLDQSDEVERLHPSALRLQFTMENGEETEDIIRRYSEVFIEKRKARMPSKEYTRGHFKRGVK